MKYRYQLTSERHSSTWPVLECRQDKKLSSAYALPNLEKNIVIVYWHQTGGIWGDKLILAISRRCETKEPEESLDVRLGNSKLAIYKIALDCTNKHHRNKQNECLLVLACWRKTKFKWSEGDLVPIFNFWTLATVRCAWHGGLCKTSQNRAWIWEFGKTTWEKLVED